MARARFAAAPLALLLGSCVFIDDFERFRAGAEGDGGVEDAAVDDPDGEVPEPPRDGAPNNGRDTGPARDGEVRDARADAQADSRVEPTDARSDASDEAPSDGGSDDPPDGEDPAPGCLSPAIVPTQRCYPDRDRDGFAVLSPQLEILACTCPPGYRAVANPSEARSDCHDDPSTRGADAYPGQTSFFASGYGVGSNNYDYNCDDTEEKQEGKIADCKGLLMLALCATTTGYLEETACGRTGRYAICGQVALTCDVAQERDQAQSCR